MNVRTFLRALKDMGIDAVLIDKKEDMTLDALSKIVRNCRGCELFKTRRHVVFGEGDPKASILFVGEAPGEEEDKEGRPFVGKAGKLLDEMIERIGIRRGELYICNVLKCRPPENRDPLPGEIEACKKYLFKQIDIIKPKIIVTLGRYALNVLLGTEEKITKVRGQIREFMGIKVLPTYHPSFLLRNEARIEEAISDMRKLKEMIERI